MTESRLPSATRPERAFLDANVIRGQQTTDILLSLAHRDVFEPRWTQHVIDEMRRNRPPELSDADIDRRIQTMNKAFPRAMTSEPPQELQDQMQADPKDKHVLAGAVHSNSDVLVTDNLKDFDPPSSGPNAMQVQSLNQFLSRKLEEDPERVQAALQEMLQRYKRDPRTMSALIDTMAESQELQGFAQKLNTMVPPEQRGTSEALAANQQGSAKSVALDGMADARGAIDTTPNTTGSQRAHTPKSPSRGQGTEL